MSPGDQRLTYVYDSVRATASDVLGFSMMMQSETTTTIAKFNGLLEHGWQGEAADNFVLVCNPIFTHMHNLAEKLSVLAEAVQQAADCMEIADIFVANGRP